MERISEAISHFTNLPPKDQILTFQGIPLEWVHPWRGFKNQVPSEFSLSIFLRKCFSRNLLVLGEYPDPQFLQKVPCFPDYLGHGCHLSVFEASDLIEVKELYGTSIARIPLLFEDSLETFLDRLAYSAGNVRNHLWVVTSRGKIQSLDVIRRQPRPTLFAFKSTLDPSLEIVRLSPHFNDQNVPVNSVLKIYFTILQNPFSRSETGMQLLCSLQLFLQPKGESEKGDLVPGKMSIFHEGEFEVGIAFLPDTLLISGQEYTVTVVSRHENAFLHHFSKPMEFSIHKVHKACSELYRFSGCLMYHFRTEGSIQEERLRGGRVID